MPSSIGHAAVAVLLTPLLATADRRPAVILTAAIATAALDLDAVGRVFGAGDVAVLGGHRGVTHSLLAAVLLGGLLAFTLARGRAKSGRGRLSAYVILVIASHGILDGFTAYGEGVALFAPFTDTRWKAPWRPLDDLWPEMVALWLPAWIYYRAIGARRFFSPSRPSARRTEW